MRLIEVSVSSIEKDDCYFLKLSDFIEQSIPVPLKGYTKGDNSDVLIYFENVKEMENYIEHLAILRDVSNSLECKTNKLKKIIDTIGNRLPLERMKEIFKEKRFIDITSGFPYRFIDETLNISNAPYSTYNIIEKDNKHYFVSQLSGTPLLIDINPNTNVIVLRNEIGKLIVSLQPE